MKHNYYNPYYDDNEYISAQGPEPDDALSEKYPFIVSLRRATLLNNLP